MRRGLSALALAGMVAVSQPASAALVEGVLTGVITGHEGNGWMDRVGLPDGAWGAMPFSLAYSYDPTLADFHLATPDLEAISFWGNSAGWVAIRLTIGSMSLYAMTNPSSGVGVVQGEATAGGSRRTMRTSDGAENDPGTQIDYAIAFSVDLAAPFVANQSLYRPVSWEDAPSSVVIMLTGGMSLSGTASPHPVLVPAPGGAGLLSGAVGALLFIRHRCVRRRHLSRVAYPTGDGTSHITGKIHA